MIKPLTSRSLFIAAAFLLFLVLVLLIVRLNRQPTMISAPKLLTEPFLQLPTQSSVRVVWFTEFIGTRHTVAYGKRLSGTVTATTTKLSRTREDQKSRVGTQVEDAQIYQQPTRRDIWRHEAEVTGLTPGNRLPYRVTSVREDGQQVSSKEFTLAPKPKPETPLTILLTSDHQLMPMTAANIQKVSETVGQVDAIFHAGDLVNVPDRASEWFDDNRGGAFFPCLQGQANYQLERNGTKTTYHGSELIQNAPLFPATGNHEVMGRFNMVSNLSQQFGDAFPRAAAEGIYQTKASQINPNNDPKTRAAWIKDNSFNTDTYEEIFTLPNRNQASRKATPGIATGNNYYALTFGDVRLVVPYITNIWRTPSLGENARGRYRESKKDLNNPSAWGYGQHIFEPIAKGSAQYRWLEAELNSSEFQQAKYKVVMFHHPAHSLGDNIVPAYTNPVQLTEWDTNDTLKTVRYEYPQEADYIIRDVIPLLEASGVQLVFYGHSHLWNRFVSPSGMHFLESSNVGNTYGAYIGDKRRPVPKGYQSEYAAVGDPNGLEPVIPTIAPLLGTDNQALPYIASNDIAVFSILDTGTGIVSSYRFDTQSPESKVVKFDQFRLVQGKDN